MNIKLKVLTDAVQQMRILLDKSYSGMAEAQYTEAYAAYFALKMEVDTIVSKTQVEVEAV